MVDNLIGEARIKRHTLGYRKNIRKFHAHSPQINNAQGQKTCEEWRIEGHLLPMPIDADQDGDVNRGADQHGAAGEQLDGPPETIHQHSSAHFAFWFFAKVAFL